VVQLHCELSKRKLAIPENGKIEIYTKNQHMQFLEKIFSRKIHELKYFLEF